MLHQVTYSWLAFQVHTINWQALFLTISSRYLFDMTYFIFIALFHVILKTPRATFSSWPGKLAINNTIPALLHYYFHFLVILFRKRWLTAGTPHLLIGYYYHHLLRYQWKLSVVAHAYYFPFHCSQLHYWQGISPLIRKIYYFIWIAFHFIIWRLAKMRCHYSHRYFHSETGCSALAWVSIA